LKELQFDEEEAEIELEAPKIPHSPISSPDMELQM
jgi:hypothetical protein